MYVASQVGVRDLFKVKVIRGYILKHIPNTKIETLITVGSIVKVTSVTHSFHSEGVGSVVWRSKVA